MKLVLASKSPRREELLSWLGIPFEVRESGFDETGISSPDAKMLTSALAIAKAQTVAEKMKVELMPSVRIEKEMVPQRVEPTFVLGADTVVFLEGETIGKPRDLDHAREILQKLRGKTHEVYTGVAIVDVLTNKQKAFSDKSLVTFRDFSDKELEDYIATSEPMGKAGAYMVVGKAKDLVAGIEGSVTNVVGLPLLRVAEMMGGLGIKIEVDVAKAIEEKTGYQS